MGAVTTSLLARRARRADREIEISEAAAARAAQDQTQWRHSIDEAVVSIQLQIARLEGHFDSMANNRPSLQSRPRKDPQ